MKTTHLKLLDLKQIYLKVLMCGINASGAQWCGCISILYNTLLKFALFLNKTVILNYLMSNTACRFSNYSADKN